MNDGCADFADIAVNAVLCKFRGQRTLKVLNALGTKPYEKIIGKTTRDVLRPAGFSQKGASRFWYLDCGWYACFAEFQPYSGRQGTTLNFGVSWLWYPREHWTLDIFNRAERFFDYKDDDSFRLEVLSLSNQAVEYCSQTRATINTPADAYAFVENHKKKTDWHAFNLAVLAGLSGQPDTAQSLFDAAYLPQTQIAWEEERNEIIGLLKNQLTNRQSFERCISERIIEARALLKLPATLPIFA